MKSIKFKIAVFLITLSAILLSIAPAFGQTQQDVDKFKGVATGTNTYTVSIPAASSTLYDGMKIWVRFPTANTLASTLKLNSFSAIGVTLNNSNLSAGDISANQWYMLIYSSAQAKWQLNIPDAPIAANTYWELDGNAATTPGTDFLGTTDAQSLVLKTNNTERVRITSADGFVGIGTNAPANHLDIVSSSAAGSTGVGLINTDLTGSQVFNFGESLGDASFYIQRYNSNYATAALRNGVLLFNADNSYVSFGTNNTERIRILGTGDVGFRTSAPTATIHGIGSGTTSATYVLKTANSASVSLFNIRNNGAIEAANTTTQNISIGLNPYNPSTAGTEYNLAIGDGLGSISSGMARVVAVGISAGKNMTNGGYSTFIGVGAGYSYTTQSDNTAVGASAALYRTGSSNVSVGKDAGTNTTSGNENTEVGVGSGGYGTGSYNTSLGYSSGCGGAGLYPVNYVTAIGNRSNGEIYNAWGTHSINTYSSTITIGAFAASLAANQCVIGSTTAPINEVCIGRGSMASQVNMGEVVLRPADLYDGSGVSNTSASASILTIAGARGIGTGTGGDVVFKVSPAGASGSSLNSLSEAMRITYNKNIGIGSNSPNSTLHVVNTNTAQATFIAAGSASVVTTYDGRLYGTALHNNSGAVTGTTNQYIASGTYTATLTNVTNITASTSYQAQWTRVGNVVTVSMLFDSDQTGVGAFEIGCSLPIASNFTAVTDAAGSGHSKINTGDGIYIEADATNDRISIQGNDNDLTNHKHSITFTYLIQ